MRKRMMLTTGALLDPIKMVVEAEEEVWILMDEEEDDIF